jgi:hypothetical protein
LLFEKDDNGAQPAATAQRLDKVRFEFGVASSAWLTSDRSAKFPANMKNRLSFTPVLLALVVAGCANPGIVQLSPDTYMLSRADRAGIFGNTAALKAGVIKDASEFAAKQGKVAIPIASNETPVYPGHFATFEYQFRVVDKNDPEARRTSLVPRPDVVIEKTDKISADVRTKDEKSPDLYAELTKLDDLRKKGIITEEEFAAQKKRLFERQ